MPIALPGHPRTVHWLVSVLFPMHVLPPFCGGGLEHILVRVLVPCPHDVLQVVHGTQFDHAPSTENMGYCITLR